MDAAGAAGAGAGADEMACTVLATFANTVAPPLEGPSELPPLRLPVGESKAERKRRLHRERQQRYRDRKRAQEKGEYVPATKEVDMLKEQLRVAQQTIATLTTLLRQHGCEILPPPSTPPTMKTSGLVFGPDAMWAEPAEWAFKEP